MDQVEKWRSSSNTLPSIAFWKMESNREQWNYFGQFPGFLKSWTPKIEINFSRPLENGFFFIAFFLSKIKQTKFLFLILLAREYCNVVFRKKNSIILSELLNLYRYANSDINRNPNIESQKSNIDNTWWFWLWRIQCLDRNWRWTSNV